MHFNRDIQDLTEAITQLQIAQIRLDSVLRRIREDEETRERRGEERQCTVEEENNSSSETEEPEGVTRFFLLNSRFKVGDRVRIVNPRSYQQDRGIIIGTNRAGNFITVRTANGSEVNRIPRNLRPI